MCINEEVVNEAKSKGDKIDKNKIKMRVWERGAGETLACGTGACASVVACNLNDYINKKCTVTLLGGNLFIEWNEKDNHIYRLLVGNRRNRPDFL